MGIYTMICIEVYDTLSQIESAQSPSASGLLSHFPDLLVRWVCVAVCVPACGLYPAHKLA